MRNEWRDGELVALICIVFAVALWAITTGSGCGARSPLPHHVVTDACLLQERHIVERQGSSRVEDLEDMERLRRDCDNLLHTLEVMP